MTVIIALYILLGLITGVIAGLLGIGGGLITVPSLYYIISHTQVFEGQPMHVAIATSLATTFFTSIGSSFAHYKRGTILFQVVKTMVPALIIGCVSGAVLSLFFSNFYLKWTFGLFSVLFSILFFFPQVFSWKISISSNKVLNLLFLGVGALSSLLGVGGGIFMVPLLLGYQLPLKNAIAISSVGTLISSLTGSIAFLIIGESQNVCTTTGWIDMQAFLLIGLSSLLTTSIGVKLSHIIPVPIVKKLFAIVLAATGLLMMLG